MFRSGVIDTPCGRMRAVVDEQGALVSLMFVHSTGDPAAGARWWEDALESRADDSAVSHVAAEMDAYFMCAKHSFEIPLAPRGTAFMHRVWRLLRAIPAGRVTTYKALAEKLAPASSPRAVGRANALNPLAIVVPCHRMVGHNGTLTGYEGGLERKAWLLRHEGLETIVKRGMPRIADPLTLPCAGSKTHGVGA